MELTGSGALENSTDQVVLLATRGEDSTVLFVDLCAMYCRLCLERAHEARQLDDALVGSVTIREAIEATVGILTEINSLAPTIVCRNCMPKLKFALAFRQGCASSDEQMKQALEALDGLQQDALIYVDGENGLGSTFTETLEMLRDVPIETEDAINEEEERPLSTDGGSWEFENKDHDLVDDVAEHGVGIELIEEYLDSEDGFIEPWQACDASIANLKLDGVIETDADLWYVATGHENSNQTNVGEDSERNNGTAVISETNRKRVEKPHETEKARKENASISRKSKKESLENSFLTDSASSAHISMTTSKNGTKSKPTQLKAGKASSSGWNKTKSLELTELDAHTCYYCSMSYGSAGDLEDHLSTHILLLPFTCSDCHTEQFPMVFSTLVALNRHLQSHLFPYRCPECPKRFLKLRSMENHITQKHREEINPAGYGCERCGASFERCHQLQRHMRAHETEDSGRFRCEYCQRAFGTGTCLRRHRRIHTGDKPYACKYCGKRFNHEHNFANHKRLHLGERIHVCEVCHKSYTTGTGLRLHLADHFPDDPRYGPRQKNVQPKQTPARYPEKLNAFSLEGIAITKAPDSSSRIYQCTATDDCRFTTGDYNRIFYHRQTHIKRFECDRCGKRFTIRSSLVKHVARVHDKAHTAAEHRTHLCSQCGKTFPTWQKFQRHIDSHRGNKQYRCRYCEKDFVQKANCKAHERIHTGENPYSILGGHKRSTQMWVDGSCG